MSEDATNPVFSSEAAEEAAQRLKHLGLELMTCGPRAGGVLPSPGHEAARALEEIAALRQGIGNAQATWGEHYRALEVRVTALEDGMKAAIDTLETVGRAFQGMKRRVEALEALTTAQSDALEASAKTVDLMADRILAIQRRLLSLDGRGR